MSYNIIFTQGTATVTVPAGEKIAVQAYSPASVFQEVGFPNFPEAQDLLTVATDNTTYVSSAFTIETNVTIQAGASGAYYAVGVAPTISNNGNWQPQGAPANIADGGSMIATAAEVLTGIVTATPTTTRSIQLPLATNLDLATEFAIGDSFDFSVITLAAFTLTITVNTGVTIVGSAATAATAGASARFRLRKTATATYIVYRIS
jgi:hypothetical protein